MFGRGNKKKAAAKTSRGGKQQARRGPLRYLSLGQTVQYGQRLLEDVRGHESLAYPVLALVAWRTYQSERRRQLERQAAVDTARIRESLVADLTGRPKRKRFIIF